jgi:hypothetical protein
MYFPATKNARLGLFSALLAIPGAGTPLLVNAQPATLQ